MAAPPDKQGSRQKGINRSGGERQGEDAFVARYLAPLSHGDHAALGLLDDVALLKPRDHHAFAITCDTLIEGRHFLFDGTPKSATNVAHKALAVNVSDLAAKGATPRAYLMSLALPPGNFEAWMPAFVETLGNCQRAWGLTLIGGDTVSSPDRLEITITAIGEVLNTRMIPRTKAEPGDGIYVSGTIGDATLGLALASGDQDAASWHTLVGNDGAGVLETRYQRPSPRTELTKVLFDNANAAIDVSDGLVRDLARICTQSGVGAKIDRDLVPVSAPARKLVKAGKVALAELFTGGDDYEILACVSKHRETAFIQEAANVALPVTKIGTITPCKRVSVVDSNGDHMEFSKTGWDHLG